MKKILKIFGAIFTIIFTIICLLLKFCNIDTSLYNTSIFKSQSEYEYVKKYYNENIKTKLGLKIFFNIDSKSASDEFAKCINLLSIQYNMSKKELLETISVDKIQKEFSSYIS